MTFREKSDSFVNKSLILRVNGFPNMRILLHYIKRIHQFIPCVHKVDPRLRCLHVYQMLREALQLRFEFDNQFHRGTHVDIVVVGL